MTALRLDGEEATVRAGRLLAEAVLNNRPGDRAFRIDLIGPLGAGKTTLSRGFLREAGATGPVPSPTYTLVEPYPLDAVLVIHVDLYRINGATEAEALGLREYDAPGAVWLVEWPERLAGPAADLAITLAVDGDSRRMTLAAEGANGLGALEAFSAKTGEL